MDLFDTFPYTKFRGKNRGLDWVVQKLNEFKATLDTIPQLVTKAVEDVVNNGAQFEIVTDKTLTLDNVAADSAAVGARFKGLKAADIGARPDSWTPTAADVGAAPTGFGLGANPGEALEVADCNGVFACGWYRCRGGINSPLNRDGSPYYGLLFVSSGDYVRQDFYTSQTDPSHLVRYYVDGVWGVWEWVNPPMLLGVEYRTTERCEGKIVYAKRIVYTPDVVMGGSNDSTMFSIPHGVSNFDLLVRCCGRLGGNYPLPLITASGGSVSVYSVNAAGVNIHMYKHAEQASLYFDLYYTKSV